MPETRKQRKYREAIGKGLGRAYADAAASAEEIELDGLRWIVLSDLHKGARDGADDFRRCERSYNAALAYYLEQRYTLAVLGDVEELWECAPAEVLTAYAHTLDLEKEFHALGRYRRFWGNHDDAWRHPREVEKHLHQIGFTGLAVPEALRLRVRRDADAVGELFLVHGHQGTAESDRFGWFSRLVVRHIWRPLQRRLDMPSTTPSRDWALRAQHESAMFRWARECRERPVLITGHTHRPVFGDSRPEPKTARTVAEVERDLAAARAAQPPDVERVATLRAELEFIAAEERRVDTPQPVEPPCYFNTGCCSFGDGDITGLELADGEIRLVRWSCDDGAPHRRVLAHDALVNVLAAVAGRAAVPS
jgi:UDP-2,3-diacylglucosamine pyrophosphatase LpxH